MLKRARVLFFTIVAVGAVSDLATKAVMQRKFTELHNRIPPVRHIDVLPGVRLEWAENRGVAWGMLSERNARWLIVALSALAFPLIVWYFWREPKPAWPFTAGLASIAGGTIGNLHDRLLYGHVRDFVYVHAIDFPIFNVADSFICVGAALFALEQFLVKKKAPAEANDKSEISNLKSEI